MMRVSLLAAVDWTLTFLCLPCVCRVLFPCLSSLPVALRMHFYYKGVVHTKIDWKKYYRSISIDDFYL